MALAAIIGVGMIPFGKHESRSLVGMGAEACRLALKDAHIKPGRVDAAFFSSGLAPKLFGDFTVGQNVFWEVGINRIPVINVENACTSGSTAFFLANNMVAAGQAEMVLVCGAEKMCVPGFGLISSGESQLDTQLGHGGAGGLCPSGRAPHGRIRYHQGAVWPGYRSKIAPMVPKTPWPSSGIRSPWRKCSPHP